MNKHALTLSALAATLAGCAVGPDYQRPVVELPAQYAEPAIPATQSALQNDWWKLFGDARLDELVAQAQRHNADLQGALARIEEAEAAMREVGAALLPEVDFDAAASRSHASTATAIPMPPGTPVLRDARKAALTTAFEIDLWGKLRRASEAARAQALASRHARDALRISLTGLVASHYLALRGLDAQLALLTDSRASRLDTLKIVNIRRDAGLASPLEVQQAQAQLAGLDAQLAGLRQQRAASEHLLALLCGVPGLTVAAGDPKTLPMPPTPPAGLPSSLLEARPDIRQAEEELAAANAKIGVAKAAYFPTLSLTASLGSESKALSDLFSGAANTWSLGFGLVAPVFDAGRTGARVEQAEARQKQLLANYRKTVQSAFKEVNDALAGLRESGSAEQAQEQRRDAARQSLHLTELRVAAGYSGQLDALEARRAANDAELAQVSARQARLTAAVELFKALGGGWRNGG